MTINFSFTPSTVDMLVNGIVTNAINFVLHDSAKEQQQQQQRSLKARASSVSTLIVSIDEAEESLSDRESDESATTITEEENLPPLTPLPLERAHISGRLSQLGTSADGTQVAYLRLSLPDLGLTEASLLSAFCHVQDLDLSNNRLTSLAPLSALRHLVRLNAANNSLTELLAIDPPPLSLVEANFSGNRIDALPTALTAASSVGGGGGGGYSWLEVLDVSNNRLREVKVGCLMGCTRLRKVVLSNNYLRVPTGVAGLCALEHLDMSGNRLKSLSKLGALPLLRHLDVSHNRLSSLDGCEELPQLGELLASNNRIVDIAETVAVRDLEWLRALDLRSNAVCDAPDYRLLLAYRFQRLRLLDRHRLTPQEKVEAVNLCDPPLEVVAAVDHAMQTSKAVFRGTVVEDVTGTSPDRPYPLLVLCGPWGMNKHGLRERLLKEYPRILARVLCHTTRSPREEECEGIDYHFADPFTVDAAVDEGEFLQTSRVLGHFYGLTHSAINAAARTRKIGVLCMEVEGVASLRLSHLKPIYVCIVPKDDDTTWDAWPRERRAAYDRAISEGWFQYVIKAENANEAFEGVTGDAMTAVTLQQARYWLNDQQRYA